MKKKNLHRLLLLLLLVATMASAQIPTTLTHEDCSLIFPRTDFCRILRDAEGAVYGEAWYRGLVEDADEFLGYVFTKPLVHEGKAMNLLVGIDKNGRISRVKIKGLNAVNDEFLVQFEGKTFDHSFEMARTPEELLFVPAKLRAIAGNLLLSDHIATGVKAVMQSARKLFNQPTRQEEACSTY
ncbi:MAG: hypothetical protein ONB44_03915 [candidate division KSB1 bacterium]|nr:hypothetical protein [candidate division KSB1 bacterium]MDZ7301276.1 hypothetical protein [candidate division KSB1 bacterium]MDZ7310839.1 hypothetical protein [candidate division KSB1 bacterium]